MTTKTKLDTVNKRYSRRQALKAIAAAGGAVTLAHLPEKWHTPVVEVGALPAHAQVSPWLRVTVTYRLSSGINNCSNGNGTLYTLVITYEDSSGNVSGASQLTVVSTFNPGGRTGFTYNGPLSGWPRSSSIGSRSGTLSAQLCTIFGGSASNTINVTLTNDVGDTASTSYTAPAPPGANSTDDNEPAQSLQQ